MKLFHYVRRDGVENFGDRLNLWLWPKLIPNLLSARPDTTWVGTGTLLNNLLPGRLDTQRAIVFSSGAGYERPLSAIPEGWQIACVRGPLSAQRLGLPGKAAIADGGLLIRQVFTGGCYKRFPVAFMPHIHHVAADRFWETLCQDLGWQYIDPRWQVEPVLKAIDSSELLLAEAMHGAIAADALRVPWIPVHTSARILDFKWHDWCASMEVPYRPQLIPPPLPYQPVALGLRSGLRAAHHWQRCWRQGRWRQSQGAIAAQLGAIAQRVSPSLSQQAVLNQRIEQLMDCLEAVRVTVGRVSG